MKKMLMLVALGMMLMPVAGCETLTDTAAENRVRLRHAAAMNLRQVNNDLEYILYLERPVWLSRYPIPND
jgi:hypothetical protein